MDSLTNYRNPQKGHRQSRRKTTGKTSSSSSSWCCSFKSPPKSPEAVSLSSSTKTQQKVVGPTSETLSKSLNSFPNSPQSSKSGLTLVGRIDPRRILSPGRVSPIDSDVVPPKISNVGPEQELGHELGSAQKDDSGEERENVGESVVGVNDEGVFDVRLSLKGKNGSGCLVLELNSKVLGENSSLFDGLIRDSKKSGGFCRIEVPDVENLGVFRETIELMFEDDITKKLIKIGAFRAIEILEVSASIKFKRGVLSCLKYLEAVPWTEEEEEKLRRVFNRFKFDDATSTDIFSRLNLNDCNDPQQKLARQVVRSITNCGNAKARNELKYMVKGLLSKSSVYKKDYLDITKEDLYSICQCCLSSLVTLFEEATDTAQVSCKRNLEKPLIESISWQVENINWLLEILLDRQIAEDFGGVFSRTKTLLNEISGEARDGEVMAVLGASGSGKSTLIDALANRIARGSLKGKITLNGEPLESRLLKVISAYVMQDDLLFPMLTVEETLMFSAEFRLPRTLSKSKKATRVQQLIDQLGLRNAAKTIIGDEGHRGVSGGERRRVSIGIDIIHDPIILFLDEPTSGLDSTSAYMVVKVLQRIAQSGSIVVMSIHQPSYRIMGLLDRLLFLSKGQTVFSGSPSEIPGYFGEFGSPIPENENKTEFALDLIRELEGSQGGTKALVEFHKGWQVKRRNAQPNIEGAPQDSRGGLSLKEAISASISRGKLVSGATNTDASPASMVPTFANPFWTEIVTLSKRSVMNSRRMPELFGIRLGAVLVTGFILATMFWQLDNSPKGVQERLGFFAFAMSTTFYTCADALPVFLQERYIFMRETAYNAYRRSSYVLSHALTALPSLIFLSFAFAATTFWAVGLDGGVSGFFFYFGIIFASFWAGNSFVSFLSGVVPHVMLGYVIVVAILAYFLLFSGFFINRDRIPNYWIWFHYLSLVKYPYEGVLQNEFEDPTKCFIRGVQIFDNTPLGAVPGAMKVRLLQTISGSLGMTIAPSTCVTTGADILQQQGVTDLSKWGCFWVTVAWGFFFRILFYFTLLLGSKNKRS